MKIWKRTWVLALPALLLLPACSSDASGPGDGESLRGTWLATSVAGQSLPLHETFDFGGASCTYTLHGVEITFHEGDEFDSTADTSTQCGSDPVERTTDSVSGTYRLSGNRVYLKTLEPEESEESYAQFEVSGSTLRLTESNNGETVTYVFQRK